MLFEAFRKCDVWYRWFAWRPVLAIYVVERRVMHRWVWLQKVWRYHDSEYGLNDYCLNEYLSC